ncbi:MAG: hypothetical protein ACM65L_03675 [Microcoleus sp.]
MKIPSVRQGLIEAEDGKVFQLNSPKGVAWLETIGSFRYEPTGDGKPYTVRKEASAYWYGCRKIEGKVRKKYIGKSSGVNIARLEEIAEALEIPTEPRVKQVAEVVERVAEVAQSPQVTEKVAESRVTALELQVAALVKAVEALQEALPGKPESGDSQELPKVDNEVAERLQNELSNLKAENQKLKTDYATLLESSTLVTNKLRQELQEVRSQLETERTRWDELQEELDDREEICAQLRSELSDLRQKSVIASQDFPESADLLNQLKGRRKKSKADLADMEAVLDVLAELGT